MRFIKTLIYLCLACIFLVSCGKITEKKKTSTVPQVLNLNFDEGDIPSLSPHDLQGDIRCYTVSKLLFEGLTRVNEKGFPELSGAKHVEISPCKTKFTFSLRPNHWSNHEPVTAYDYEQAWKHALDPKSDCQRSDLLYVIKNAEKAKKGSVGLDQVGVKALDAHTLFVELEFPAPYFLSLASMPIFSPIRQEELQSEICTFNGPFVVNKWEKGHFIHLKNNPYFWDHASPRLKEIHITMVLEPNTAMQMYEKKQIDWIGDPLSAISYPALSSVDKRYDLHTKEVVRPFWLFLNTQHPVLRSASIRKALSASLDREAIANHILIMDEPLDEPLPPQFSLGSPPLASKDYKSLLTKGLEELNLDLSQLPEITISYCYQPPFKQFAEYLQETWKEKLGLSIKLEGYEWAILYSDMQKGNFQIAGCHISPHFEDAAEPLQRLEDVSPSNFSQWMHSIYLETLQASRAVGDVATRRATLQEAESILIQEMPIIPVSNHKHYFTHRPGLKGYVFNYAGCIDFANAYFE